MLPNPIILSIGILIVIVGAVSIVAKKRLASSNSAALRRYMGAMGERTGREESPKVFVIVGVVAIFIGMFAVFMSFMPTR